MRLGARRRRPACSRKMAHDSSLAPSRLPICVAPCAAASAPTKGWWRRLGRGGGGGGLLQSMASTRWLMQVACNRLPLQLHKPQFTFTASRRGGTLHGRCPAEAPVRTLGEVVAAGLRFACAAVAPPITAEPVAGAAPTLHAAVAGSHSGLRLADHHHHFQTEQSHVVPAWYGASLLTQMLQHSP